MGYLLDTHVFLWALSDPERIRGPVLHILLNPAPRKGLKVETFKKDTLHIIAAPGHPLAKKGSVALADLSPFIS